MPNFHDNLKIFADARPTDMRKGFNGLCGIVREEFNADPTDGSLFVFVNRRRDRMKLLHFSGGGFWLYYRLLEAGTFEAFRKPAVDKSNQNQPTQNQLVIDATELSMLLAGVSLVAADNRRKRFVAKAS